MEERNIQYTYMTNLWGNINYKQLNNFDEWYMEISAQLIIIRTGIKYSDILQGQDLKELNLWYFRFRVL